MNKNFASFNCLLNLVKSMNIITILAKIWVCDVPQLHINFYDVGIGLLQLSPIHAQLIAFAHTQKLMERLYNKNPFLGFHDHVIQGYAIEDFQHTIGSVTTEQTGQPVDFSHEISVV